MSQSPQPGLTLLALADASYRALLNLYPRAFRQAFGLQMAQVFHEDCQRVQAKHGAPGLLKLWLFVMCDLAVTATQEHFSKEARMSRSTFSRVAGAVALLGGALNGISFLIHPQGLARAIVPASVVCLIVGILGLHALLWGREGRLGLLGLVLVGAGLTLGVIGMGGSAVGILDPNPLAPIINTGEHAGLVFIGAGMLLWGIVTLRQKALGPWSILPLVMGLFALSGIVFVNPAAFSALENSAMPEVFAFSWMLFGFALLTSRTDPWTVSTPAAPG